MSSLREKLLRVVGETRDPLRLPQEVLRVFAEHLGADFGGLYFRDPSLGALRVIALYGTDRVPPHIPQKLWMLSVESGLAGRAFRERHALVVTDYPRWSEAIPEVVEAGARSVVSVPLFYGQTVGGVLSLAFFDKKSIHADLLEELESAGKLAAVFVGLSVEFRLHQEHDRILQALFEGIARLSQENLTEGKVPGFCALDALFGLPEVAVMIVVRRRGNNLVFLPETLRVKPSLNPREIRRILKEFPPSVPIQKPSQSALAEAVFLGKSVFLEPQHPQFQWRHPSGERVYTVLSEKLRRPVSLVILPVKVLGEVDRLVIFAEDAPVISGYKRRLYQRFAEVLGLSLTARFQDQLLGLQRDVQTLAFQRKTFREILEETLPRLTQIFDIDGLWVLSQPSTWRAPLHSLIAKGPRLPRRVVFHLPQEDTFQCETRMWNRIWTLAGMRYQVNGKTMILLAGRRLSQGFLRSELQVLQEFGEVLRFVHQDLAQWQALEQARSHLEERVRERTSQLNALLALTEQLHRVEDFWEVPAVALKLLAKGLQSPLLICGLRHQTRARLYLYRKAIPPVEELSRVQRECLKWIGAESFDEMRTVENGEVSEWPEGHKVWLHMMVRLSIEGGGVLCLALGTPTKRLPSGERALLRSAGHILAEVLGHIHARRRRELERMVGILQSLREGVMLLDHQGRVLFANLAALEMLKRLGEHAEPGRILERLGPLEVLPRLRDLDRPYRTEISFPGKRPLILQVTLVPYAFSDHDVAAVLTLDDVTELRLQQAHLARAQRMAALGELAAGIAHEVNNPLAVIMGFAEAIQSQEGSNEAIRGMAQKIVESTHRAANVIKRLLFLAQAHRVTEKEALNLNDVILRTVEALEEAYRQQGITLRLELDPRIPPVYGEWGKLSQLVMALLSNARDAIVESGKGDTIIVRTAREKGGVCLEIEDNGPGMPEEIRERIFDPFFTTKAPGKGMGMGLTVVQQIVQEHGGNIWVASNPGEGTVFSVWLPSADRSPRSKDKEAMVSERIPGLGRHRVLLVNPDAEILSQATQVLGEGGAFLSASTAEEGIQKVKEERFDLVLWTLEDRGEDEIEAIQNLLHEAQRKGMRIVLIGKEAPSVSLLRFIRKSGVDFILKPSNPAEFREAVEKLLSGGKAP